MEVEEVVTAAPPLPGCPAAAKIEQSSLAWARRQRRKRAIRDGHLRAHARGQAGLPGAQRTRGAWMRAGTGQGGTRGAHKGRATGVASRRWQGGAGGRGAGKATGTRKWGAGRVLSLGEERLAAPARGALGYGMGGGAKVGRDGLGRGRWDHVGPTCGGRWTSWGPPPAGARHVRAMPDTSRPTAVMIRSSRDLPDRPGPSRPRNPPSWGP